MRLWFNERRLTADRLAVYQVCGEYHAYEGQPARPRCFVEGLVNRCPGNTADVRLPAAIVLDSTVDLNEVRLAHRVARQADV